MKKEKLCDYLCDKGFIEEESLKDFAEIYKNIMKNNKSENNDDNILLILNSYLSQKIKNKQSLNKFSKNIINSFSDNILINRYLGLNILYRFFFSKLQTIYTLFFTKINFFIIDRNYNDNNNKNEIKKGKIKKNKINKNDDEENNIKILIII